MDKAEQRERMYKWLRQGAKESCAYVGVNTKLLEYSDIEEDIIQEFCLEMIKNEKLAEKIYREKNMALICTIIKRLIYESRSSLYFNNKMDFSRYQKIERICEEYNIRIEPYNAYKISELMNCELSIPVIEKLLRNKKERIYPLEKYIVPSEDAGDIAYGTL